MAELSRLEQIKAERNPLLIVEDIVREATGGEKIDDDHVALLKWYGMYQHREKDAGDDTQYYMKRIKLLGGEVTLPQLKTLAEISRTYARGTADITTRQNIQFHYIRIADLPEIFRLLEGAGLTSRFAAGDGPRPICGCPVSGKAKDEVTDITPLLKEMNSFFEANAERFANLPRKFKISISGCGKHCVGHEIQDLGFTAFLQDGKVLYDLTIGGGLSRSRAVALRAKRYIRPEEVTEVAAVVGDIFRDNGNREQRGKARIRHLLADWGIERFTAEIENRLGRPLIYGGAEPGITPYHSREHFGIEPQQQPGLCTVGCAVTSGKLSADALEQIAALLEQHGAAGLRFTAFQNFVVYDVPAENAATLAAALTEAGFPAGNGIFTGRAIACTGKPYCKFSSVDTKQFIATLSAELSKRFPSAAGKITIAASGCPHGCSHPAIADIGLTGMMVASADGTKVPGFEITLGGHLAGEKGSRFGAETGEKLPLADASAYIIRLVERFDAAKAGTFSAFLAQGE